MTNRLQRSSDADKLQKCGKTSVQLGVLYAAAGNSRILRKASITMKALANSNAVPQPTTLLRGYEWLAVSLVY